MHSNKRRSRTAKWFALFLLCAPTADSGATTVHPTQKAWVGPVVRFFSSKVVDRVLDHVAKWLHDHKQPRTAAPSKQQPAGHASASHGTNAPAICMSLDSYEARQAQAHQQGMQAAQTHTSLNQACFPACRAGYTCNPRLGQCVSACNPVCASDEQCNAGECAPTTNPAHAAPADPPDCLPTCDPGFDCTDGQCLPGGPCNTTQGADTLCLLDQGERAPSVDTPLASPMLARPKEPPKDERATATLPQERTGLYFRTTLSQGLGLSSAAFHNPSGTQSETKYSALTGYATADIGFALVRGFALHMRGGLQVQLPTTIRAGAQASPGQRDRALFNPLVGAGFTYYFPSSNLYVGLVGSALWLANNQAAHLLPTVLANAEVGKEWWLDRGVSMGLGLRYGYSPVVRQDRAHHLQDLGLVVSLSIL